MFRNQVLLAARLRSAEGYLDRTITTPNPKIMVPTLSATKWWDKILSHQEWQVQNVWTLELIVYNTKNPIGLGINMSATAAKVWETLKEAYSTISGEQTQPRMY